MKERPILFSAPMVRAILKGQKTQTRRVIKNTGTYAIEDHHGVIAAKRERAALATQCRFGNPGDRLWVRETWQGPLLDSEEHEAQFHDDGPEAFQKPGFCAYRATDNLDAIDADGKEIGWRPSIHMPRWASRINLEITGVRVERLNDISEEDAKAEGADCLVVTDKFTEQQRALLDLPLQEQANPYRNGYALLWCAINGDGAWDANPWVWVVEFKRVMP